MDEKKVEDLYSIYMDHPACQERNCQDCDWEYEGNCILKRGDLGEMLPVSSVPVKCLFYRGKDG